MTRIKAAWLPGIFPINLDQVPMECVAGITLAALAIPEVMGYATIAGMPVVTGLYTLLFPVIAFAFLGSSRHLVIGADSATAAIMASSLSLMATPGSDQYVALAGAAALLVAALLLVARIIRLGFLADFLSRSVLIGFLTGVGLQVAVGQLPDMLGIKAGGRSTITLAMSIAVELGHAQGATALISLATIGLILLPRIVTKRIPGALIAVVVALGASRIGDFAGRGIAVTGPVPGGLPGLVLPHPALDAIPQLLPMCLAMFFVILAQSAATSRAYAARFDETVSEDRDIIGLAIGNAIAGFSGTFVVNGSPTKTQMVVSSGGRSQASQLTAALMVIVVLIFLTGPLRFLPQAVLATIVFLIGIELVDLGGLKRVWHIQPAEFVVALIATVAVITVGVEPAVILAMALSLLEHVRQGYKPVNKVLTRDAAGHWHFNAVSTAAQAAPGLVIYRFNHSMYYANAPRFLQEVRTLTANAPLQVRWFCVDGDAIDDIDFSACMALLQAQHMLMEKNIRLVFVSVADLVRQELDRAGITDLVGKEAFFSTLSQVVTEYERDLQSTKKDLAPTGQ